MPPIKRKIKEERKRDIINREVLIKAHFISSGNKILLSRTQVRIDYATLKQPGQPV